MINPAGAHSDATADAIAITACIRDDDTEGLAAVLANCGLAEVVVTMGKLLAEACDEAGLTPERWREWAAEAVTRG